MSANSAKGALAERAVIRVLRRFWGNADYRRPGNPDRGDVGGTPRIAWEVRNRREQRLVPWMRDATARGVAADADYGILVIKPDGMGESTAHAWPAILPLEDMCRLLAQAGYTDEPF